MGSIAGSLVLCCIAMLVLACRQLYVADNLLWLGDKRCQRYVVLLPGCSLIAELVYHLHFLRSSVFLTALVCSCMHI